MPVLISMIVLGLLLFWIIDTCFLEQRRQRQREQARDDIRQALYRRELLNKLEKELY